MKNLILRTLLVLTVLIQGQALLAQNCSINAGVTQNVCSTTATLTGNRANSFSGNPTWSFISGPVTPVIVSPTSLTTNITGMSTPGAYVFRISQKCTDGSTVFNDVTINAYPNPGTNAGPDQSLCNYASAFTMAGSAIPAGWTGTWSVISTGPGASASDIIISNPNSPTTIISLKAAAQNCTSAERTYRLFWTLTSPTGLCVYTDDVFIKWYPDLANVDYTRTYSICGTSRLITPSTTCVMPFFNAGTTTVTLSNVRKDGLAYNGLTVTTNSATAGTFVVSGMNTPGVYTFDVTITTPCGTRTYTGFTITANQAAGSPVSVGPDIEICLASSNPSSVTFNFTAADATYTYGTPTTSTVPSGSSTPVAVISGASTAKTVTVNRPSPSGWVPGRYTIGINYQTTAGCTGFFSFYIYVFDATNPVYDVRDTSVCAPVGATSATITIPNPSNPASYLPGNLSVNIAFTNPDGSNGGTAFGFISTGSNLIISKPFLIGTTTVKVTPTGVFADEWACGGGPALVDSFKVTVVPNYGANAGTDQNITCINGFALAGNVPASPKVGTWTVVSKPASAGPISFSDTHSATSTIGGSGPATAGTYVFQWTVVDPTGVCPTYTDQVSITTTQNCILPLTLSSFNVLKNNNNAYLNWATASEQNTSRFEIEESSDGRNYKTIGTVAAAGNSTATINYNFTHNKPTAGTHYYRIKMIDKDGNFTYSAVRILNFGNGVANIIIYPNPAKDNITVSGIEAGMQLRVMGADGKLVIAQNAKNTTETIKVAALAQGVYILQTIKDGAVTATDKFIKN